MNSKNSHIFEYPEFNDPNFFMAVITDALDVAQRNNNFSLRPGTFVKVMGDKKFSNDPV